MPLAAAPSQFANVIVNIGLFSGGLLIGSVLVFLGRKFVRRYTWDGFPHLLVVIDAILVVGISLLSSSLGLLSATAWNKFDALSASGYVFLGVLISSGVGSKWLLSVSRAQIGQSVKALTEKLVTVTHERDSAITLEALVHEVMKPKVSRLAARRRANQGLLEQAIAPEKQIHVILQVLHGHLLKRLSTGRRLRIGIYMLTDDKSTLEPVYSWDGQRIDCFSNQHREFMKVGNPGGGRSVVVECWLSSDGPFKFVPNSETAQKEGKFRFFYAGQEDDLCSMVAFRHNLTELSPDDAFIITLDTNQAGFFGVDLELECRMLLPAFARRIELEFFALPLTESLTP